MFYNRKSEPGSACISRTILMDPIESLKNARLVAQRNPWAVIFKSNDHVATVVSRGDFQFDPVGAAVFQSILDEVEDDLFQAEWIGLEFWQGRREVNRDHCIHLLDHAVEALQDPMNTLLEIDQFIVKTELF